IVTRHLNEQVEPPSLRHPTANIDAGLERLVMQCLSKERDQRPESAAVLARMLTDLLPRGAVDTTGRVTMEGVRQHRREHVSRASATRQVRAVGRDRKKFVIFASVGAVVVLAVAAI